MATKSKTSLKAVVPATVSSEAVETALKATGQAATQHMESTLAMTNEQIEKTTQQVTKAIEELSAFNKETMDTLIQCSTVMTKGAEEISRILMATTQANLEQAMNTGKAVMGIKTIRDLVELQTTYTKTVVDSMLKDSGKISEVGTRITNEVLEPIGARVSDVVTKFSKAA